MKNRPCRLTKRDILNLTCFFCLDQNGLLITAFSNLPLQLKRHCIQVGAVAGLMAAAAPETAVPPGMPREEYANAVRYGGFYHDIGAYLVYNQRRLYPDAGERLLREQLDERALSPAARRVLLETVHLCGERYDGLGYPDRLAGTQIPLHAELCAIADGVDMIVSGRQRMFRNLLAEAESFIASSSGIGVSPAAAGCFTAVKAEIFALYRGWRKNPPFWLSRDLKPLGRPIEKAIG